MFNLDALPNDEDWFNDPYGTTIRLVRELIRMGITRESAMSDAEHANLLAIEEFLRTRDNA